PRGRAQRPPPTGGQRPRITAGSRAPGYPSGHVIFLTINLAVLVLCIGHRYLPTKGQVIAWAITGAIALLVAISRVYAGTHWPLDVIASLLVVVGWLCLVVSIRAISDPAFRKN